MQFIRAFFRLCHSNRKVPGHYIYILYIYTYYIIMRNEIAYRMRTQYYYTRTCIKRFAIGSYWE